MEKVIKWETLKAKAAGVLAHRQYCGEAFPTKEAMLAIVPAIKTGVHPQVLLKEWYDAALKIVDQWDVRCCDRLIKCFPEIYKKGYRRIVMDMNEKNEWVVILTY
jgi:hypothetical protein